MNVNVVTVLVVYKAEYERPWWKVFIKGSPNIKLEEDKHYDYWHYHWRDLRGAVQGVRSGAVGLCFHDPECG